ncbi:MAG: hypothetical protein F6K65_02960 [Moorea sp. SIO3C2]|nr:hypothetical protein [Moorena sp. SIO3C2]
MNHQQLAMIRGKGKVEREEGEEWEDWGDRGELCQKTGFVKTNLVRPLNLGKKAYFFEAIFFKRSVNR